jgi:hypothetical protein
MKEDEEMKEPFCGACVAGVAALAGAGAAKSSDNLGKTQKSRRLIFWISISITILSILYLVYQLMFGNCSECA